MSIGASNPRRMLLPLLAAALVGCEVSATQIVVVVDTDMAIPGSLDGFRTRVTRPAREDGDIRRFTLAESRADALPARLPASFGVAPRDGDDQVKVEVAVEALHGDEVLFETRAVTGFVEHEVLRLDLFLAERCVVGHFECDADETCTIEGCVPPFVDPGTLPHFDGLDAGWRDAGPDAPSDAATDTPPDAAADAGPDAAPDGGPAPPPDFALVIAETDEIGVSPALLRAGDDALYVLVPIDGPLDIAGAGILDTSDAADRDTLLARYDTSGRLTTWAQLGAAGARVTVYAAANDGEGGLLVGGSYGGAPDFDGTVLPAAVLPGGTAFVARFHEADVSLDWVRTYPSGTSASVQAVAFDPVSGVVAIGGNFDGDIDLGGVVSAPRTAFLALLDPVDHAVDCRLVVGNVNTAVIGDVHFEPGGSVLAGGRFAGLADLGDGRLIDPGGVGRAGFLARYSTDCALGDSAIVSGLVSFNRALLLDGGGALIVGQVIGTLTVDGESFQGPGSFDGFASTFDEGLSHDGTTTFGVDGRDEPIDLAGRAGASPVLAGWFRGEGTVGGRDVSASTADGFVAGLGADGSPLWIETVSGTGSDVVSGVAWHPTTSFVYALGTVEGPVDVGPTLLEPQLGRGVFLYGFAVPPTHE